jgi:hypothetical protein
MQILYRAPSSKSTRSSIIPYCINNDDTQLYGSSVIKPNHHYATHVANCARNFGPLNNFWTFLFEHLNRVLKSFNTNNHGQGELETTFFSEFQKTCQTSQLVHRHISYIQPTSINIYQIYTMLRYPDNKLLSEVAAIMLKATNEERGTVAGLASMLETLNDDPELADGEYSDFLHRVSTRQLLLTESVPYAFSPHHHTRHMSSDTYRLLANTICSRFPSTPIHCCSDNPVFPNSLPLERTALFFDYIVVNSKQYHASHTVGSNRSSFVHVLIPGPSPVGTYGELLEVFQLNQDFRHTGSSLRLARMRWFRPWTGEHESIWDDLCVSNLPTECSVRLLTIYASQRSSQHTSMGTRGVSRPRRPTPTSDRSTLDQWAACENNSIYWPL